MRQILFTLSRDITTRPAIQDGEQWNVYCEFNKDTQRYELMLVQ